MKELLDTDHRKEKVRNYIGHLSYMFNEIFWRDKGKVARVDKYKPTFMPAFYAKWDELDRRCLEYIEGKIEWDGETWQMEMMPLSKVPYPRLEIERDVLNYGRDLFCWFTANVKDL